MAINSNEPDNPLFRKKIQRIIDSYYEWPDILKHIDCISKLQTKYTHSIVLARKATEKDYYTNCFSYAFDLLELPEVMDKKLWENPPKDAIYPSSKFAAYLVDEPLLTEIDHGEARDGDYIIYFGDSKIEHAGKVYAGKVVSKWGGGHRWKHGLYEVPYDYGNKVRCFQQIPSTECHNAYNNWVTQKRVT